MVAHGIILKFSKYAKVQSKVQQIRQGSILSTANTPRFNLKYSKYAKVQSKVQQICQGSI